MGTASSGLGNVPARRLGPRPTGTVASGSRRRRPLRRRDSGRVRHHAGGVLRSSGEWRRVFLGVPLLPDRSSGDIGLHGRADQLERQRDAAHRAHGGRL
eukprot:9091174-Heterocapsa_arctica.AAC.1